MTNNPIINTGDGIQNNGSISIAGNYIQRDFINMSQDLSQAAAQIQELLTQLQTQGSSPEDAQQQAASGLATEAQSDPKFKSKLVKWGQSLGDAAAKTTVSEAATAVVKLALSLSGMPLP
jgi:hypothetical protein